MKTAPVGILLTLGLATALYGGWKLHLASEASVAHVAAEREQQPLRARLAELRSQQTTVETRAAAIEADNALLVSEIEKTRAAQSAAAAPAKPALVSRERAEERIQAARTLGESADLEKALAELLWCWDEGIKLLDSPRRVSRRLMVGRALEQLAERYPAALAAVRERWTNARAYYLQAGDIDGVLTEFSSLSKILKEHDAVVALYDELPAKDDRRQSVGILIYRDLVEARRYQDAATIKDLGSMLSEFGMMQTNASRPEARRYVLKNAAQNLETLAGSGSLANARELLGRILEYDSTAETREMLRSHLQRAGRPELLK